MTHNPLTDLFSQLGYVKPDPRYNSIRFESRYLTMRDGVKIAIDIVLPADLEEGRQLPVVMTMTRYWRSFDLRMPDPPGKAPMGPRESLADTLVPLGFAFVVVDGRGSGASTGSQPHPWSPDELADYGEVADWVAAQPWCNGQVGAEGISYEGTTAQLLPAFATERISGVVPRQLEFDVFPDIALPGGILNTAFMKSWSESNDKLDNNQTSSMFPLSGRLFVRGVRKVPGEEVVLAQAITDHAANTQVYPAMQAISFRDDQFGDSGATLDDFSVYRFRELLEQAGAPLFLWGSWLDGATAHTVLRAFNTFALPSVAVISASSHMGDMKGSPYGKAKAKPNPTLAEQAELIAAFLSRALDPASPPITGKTLFYYTMGEERWKRSDVFPLPNTHEQNWFLQAQHSLTTSSPTVEGQDEYQVDFSASTGTTNRWHTELPKPLIYRDRAREDHKLLTYTSPPLESPIEITGYPIVHLFIASTSNDSAFFVYLEDVGPDGTVRYLTEGQLRGLHRIPSTQDKPYWAPGPNLSFKRTDSSPLPVGEIVELTFALLPLSVHIEASHRVRLALAGADMETFARIPEKELVSWKIQRGLNHPSHISLPIIKPTG